MNVRNPTTVLLATLLVAGCANRFVSPAEPTSPEGFIPYMEQLGGQVRSFNPCGAAPSSESTEFSSSVTGGANREKGLILDQRAQVTKRGSC